MLKIRKCCSILLAMLLSLQLLLAPLPTCAANQNQPTIVTVPIATLNELDQVLTEQQVQLEMAQGELMLLKKPSTELIQQLTEAKKQLQITRNELITSKISLTAASKEISKLQSLSKSLKAQIAKEENKAALRARQHAFWGFVAGAAVCCLMSK